MDDPGVLKSLDGDSDIKKKHLLLAFYVVRVS